MADLRAALEEHLASLSDEDWRALSARVRPPADEEPSKGTHLPNVGNQPSKPGSALDLVEAQISAAQEAGDTAQVKALRLQGMSIKTAQLMRQQNP